MNRVAVFGKPSGGKSTLSKRLAVATGLPLCHLDLIEYRSNGERVSAEEYLQRHSEWIKQDQWIIEGLGIIESFWQRIDAADTLIYLDLPYHVHYWWGAKRLLISLVSKPTGWPEGSSVLKGTIATWKYLRLSPRFWTPQLYKKIQAGAQGKAVYRITSTKELSDFVDNACW